MSGRKRMVLGNTLINPFRGISPKVWIATGAKHTVNLHINNLSYGLHVISISCFHNHSALIITFLPLFIYNPLPVGLSGSFWPPVVYQLTVVILHHESVNGAVHHLVIRSQPVLLHVCAAEHEFILFCCLGVCAIVDVNCILLP